MFGRGESHETVLKEVLTENTYCKPPLGEREVRRTVDSASKYPSEASKLYRRGLCSFCGQRPHTEGGDWCEECLNDPKTYEILGAEWRQEHEA